MAVGIVAWLNCGQLEAKKGPENRAKVADQVNHYNIRINEGLQDTWIIDMGDRDRTGGEEGGEQADVQRDLMVPRGPMDTGITGQTTVVMEAGVTQMEVAGAEAKLLEGSLQEIGTRFRNAVDKNRGPQRRPRWLKVRVAKGEDFAEVKKVA
jgi:hypothetical protein